MEQNPFSEETFNQEIENETVDNEENKEIEDKKEESEKNSKEENKENKKDKEKKDEFKEKFESLNNQYIRLAADFENYSTRTAQEKEELSAFAKSEVLKKLTFVLDTFDRAQEHLKDIEECKTVKEGYEVAHKQLFDTLKKIGLEEMDVLGKSFNPNEHEAITQVETDEYEPDTIAVVAQKGYKMGDRVIRPALVGVAKAKSE